MKTFEITERETVIRRVLIEAESLEDYHAGKFEYLEDLSEDCIDCQILEIEEVEE